MVNPLAPYFNRVPTPDELAKVPADELARIVEAARSAETLNVADLQETKSWARNVRTVAQKALTRRTKECEK